MRAARRFRGGRAIGGGWWRRRPRWASAWRRFLSSARGPSSRPTPGAARRRRPARRRLRRQNQEGARFRAVRLHRQEGPDGRLQGQGRVRELLGDVVALQHEIPMFVDLQQRYGAQGLSFLGISVDDPVEEPKPFVDQHKINYPVLVGLGREEVQEAYGPMLGIPVTVVVGRRERLHPLFRPAPEGSLRSRHQGPPLGWRRGAGPRAAPGSTEAGRWRDRGRPRPWCMIDPRC